MAILAASSSEGWQALPRRQSLPPARWPGTRERPRADRSIGRPIFFDRAADLLRIPIARRGGTPDAMTLCQPGSPEMTAKGKKS